MPKQYTAMRDKFIGQGLNEKAAKTKAAKIYNSTNPMAPVTRFSDSPMNASRRNYRALPKRQRQRPGPEA